MIRLSIIICLISLKCAGQTKINATMEKFNLKKLEELKRGNKVNNLSQDTVIDLSAIDLSSIDISKYVRSMYEWNDTLKDKSVITYAEMTAGYQTTLKMYGSKYITSKQYFKDNLNLQIVAHFFSKMPIGTTLFYDHSGKLIRQVNEDEFFKFTLGDVAAKIKDIYKLDIYNDEIVSVTRDHSDSRLPYYEVHIKIGIKTDLSPLLAMPDYEQHIRDRLNRPIDTKVIVINGIDGNIIREYKPQPRY
jgi:hypothetical protein